MHSPVLINYDPTWETASYPSDWEYYSDQYWDQEPSKKRKRQRDCDGATGAIAGNEKIKKKRRKAKSAEIPEISLGESYLAASSVVWKSREEILNPNQGPVVNEGQMTKVSIIQDWRERLKNYSSSMPKFVPSSSSENAGMLFEGEGEDPMEEFDERVIVPVPAFEATRVLASRPRNLLESSLGPALEEDYDETSIYSDDGQVDAEDALNQIASAVEVDSKQGTNNGGPSTKRRKTGSSPVGQLGKFKNQINVTTTECSSNEDMPKPIEAVPLPGGKRTGRPRQQNSIESTIEKSSGKNLNNGIKTSRKRKAEAGRPTNGTSEIPIFNKKRGRQTKQDVPNEIIKQSKSGLDQPAQATASKGLEKREGSRRYQPSTLSGEVAENKVDTTDIELPNGRRSKRKAQTSVDELHGPQPKKQTLPTVKGKVSAKKGT